MNLSRNYNGLSVDNRIQVRSSSVGMVSRKAQKDEEEMGSLSLERYHIKNARQTQVNQRASLELGLGWMAKEWD